MRDAIVNGKPVTASPDAPNEATCPECDGQVRLRKRNRMDGKTTWFYRHATDEGEDCPRRYRLTYERPHAVVHEDYP